MSIMTTLKIVIMSIRQPKTLGDVKERLRYLGYPESIVGLIGDLIVKVMRDENCYEAYVPDRELLLTKGLLRKLRHGAWVNHLSADRAETFYENNKEDVDDLRRIDGRSYWGDAGSEAFINKHGLDEYNKGSAYMEIVRIVYFGLDGSLGQDLFEVGGKK